MPYCSVYYITIQYLGCFPLFILYNLQYQTQYSRSKIYNTNLDQINGLPVYSKEHKHG